MKDGEREGMLVRWGLVPFFCRGEPPKYSTINARVETIHTSPAYRGAWKRGQRCIFPVLGFYEWQVRASGKQPFFIHVADRPWFGIAGLWDSSIKADGTIVESCTIITMPASPLMAEIHNAKHRQPAMLREEDHEVWLSETPDEARQVLRLYPDDMLVAYPVSSRVNSPKNNGAELITAVA